MFNLYTAYNRQYCLVTSDGDKDDGVGALLCTYHPHNPKKTTVIQTCYWCVEDNEAGDILNEPSIDVPYRTVHFISNAIYKKSTVEIDVLQRAQHLYYALCKLCDPSWRAHKMVAGMYVNSEEMIRRFIYQLDISALFWKAQCLEDIKMMKRVLRRFGHRMSAVSKDAIAMEIGKRHRVNTVQYQWKHAITCPDYMLCRRVLQRDFAELCEDTY